MSLRSYMEELKREIERQNGVPAKCPLRTGGGVPADCSFHPKMLARLLEMGVLTVGGPCPLVKHCRLAKAEAPWAELADW